MVKNKPRILVCSIAFAAGMAACGSQRPIVYADRSAGAADRALAERAIDECMARAEHSASVERSGGGAAEEAALGAGTSATVGAAGGAAGGAVVGRAAQGAAAGAAGGAAASLTRSLLQALFARRQPDLAYRSRVDRCLRERGYDPVGWR